MNNRRAPPMLSQARYVWRRLFKREARINNRLFNPMLSQARCDWREARLNYQPSSLRDR